MEALSSLIILLCAVALVVVTIFLPFRAKRRLGTWMMAGALSVCVITVILLNRHIEQQAVEAGFANATDQRVAKVADISDAKAFYADFAAIRERVLLNQQVEKAEQEEAARAQREALEAADQESHKQEARAAADAAKELATMAPLDQQPSPNSDFGRSYYQYAHFLCTAAEYPFIRMRQDVPLCTSFFAVRDAADAVKAKDAAWIASIRSCRVFPKGTAVEWVKENVGDLPNVQLRIKAPDGGRITAYAPDNTTDGIPF